MKKIVVLSLKSNIVLLIENNNALLIDCGYDENDTKKIVNYIKTNKLFLKYIIPTHYHKDHINGLKLLTQIFKSVKVYTSLETKCIYKNEFFESYFYLDNVDKKNKNIKIDVIRNKIQFESFEIKIIKLFGHCVGNIGLIIDNILYCPDLIINSSSKLPFVSNVETYYQNLKKVKELKNIESVILSHSKDKNINFNKFLNLVEITENSLDKYNELILKNIDFVKYDEFLKKMIKLNIVTSCFTNEFNLEQYEYTEYVLKNFLIYYIKIKKIKKIYKEGCCYLERSKNDKRINK